MNILYTYINIIDSQHFPLIWIIYAIWVELVTNVIHLKIPKRLSEHSSQLVFRFDEMDGDFSWKYIVPYIMIVNFYVFGLFMENQIKCNVVCHLIVAYDFCGLKSLNLSHESKFLSHTNSSKVVLIARYSTSALDIVIVFGFLLLHEIILLPIRTQYPDGRSLTFGFIEVSIEQQ